MIERLTLIFLLCLPLQQLLIFGPAMFGDSFEVEVQTKSHFMELREDPLNWLATIGIALLAMILLYLSISSVMICYRLKHNKNMLLISITFLSIFLFTFSSILSFGCCIRELMTNDDKDPIVMTLGNFAVALYLLSQNAMLWTFTLRIESTFKGSGLEYTPKLIKFIKSTCICMIFLYLLAMSTVFTSTWNIAYICGGIWSILYLSLSIILIILFIKPIDQLMKTRLKSRIEERRSSLSSIQISIALKYHQTASNTINTDRSDAEDDQKQNISSTADHTKHIPDFYEENPSKPDTTTNSIKMDGNKEMETASEHPQKVQKMEGAKYSQTHPNHNGVKSVNMNQNVCDINMDPNEIDGMIDQDVLHVVIKHGLLVPIAICSSFTFFSTAIIIAQVRDPTAYNLIAFFWYILDCTVSSTCTYLLCSVNKKYYGVLCFLLHTICEKRKLERIKKKMIMEQREINIMGMDANNSSSISVCDGDKNGTSTHVNNGQPDNDHTR